MTYNATIGYNKLFYQEKCRVKKGSMVMVSFWEPGLLALDKNNNTLISDLKINETAKAAIKLDQLLKWNFYLNALIDRDYYKKNFSFNQSFIGKNIFNLSTKFLNSVVSLTKNFSISSGKY